MKCIASEFESVNLKRYRKKSEKVVEAMPLALPDCRVQYEQWGGSQQAKEGDWLVKHDDEYYTVESETFAKTYQHIRANHYKKIGKVWAKIANDSGTVVTKEGKTQYKEGDILVYNNKNKTDGYAMNVETFNNNYELDEAPPLMESKMRAQQYLEQRVDDQIQWYESKSAINQKRFKQCQLGAIIFGAAIPLLTAVSFEELEVVLRFTIALLGSLIAIMNALVSLYKYQENWVQYRGGAESLTREKFLFLTQSKPYSGDEDNDFKMLVERCEVIMSSENSLWAKQASAELEALKLPTTKDHTKKSSDKK